MSFLRKFSRLLVRVEGWFLVVFLAVMVTLSFAQVVLRNLFGVGFLWGDPLVRQMVLWSGFMGAAIATQSNRHISIDALSKYLPARLKALVGVITSLFGGVVCWYLARAAWTFLLEEKEAGADMVFSLPAWIGFIIVPTGYCLIALHFVLTAFVYGIVVTGRGTAEEGT